MGTDSRYCELMPQLRQLALAPLNVAQVLQARVESIRVGSFEKKAFWLHQQFDSADGLAYAGEGSNSSGRFKLVRNAELLLEIESDVHLVRGALSLSEDEYDQLPGPEFVRVRVEDEELALLTDKFDSGHSQDLAELHNLGATPLGRGLGVGEVNGKEIDEVEVSDLWLAIAGYDFAEDPNSEGNQSALNLRHEYRHLVFTGEDVVNEQGMGIYLRDDQEVPTMRACSIGGHIIDNKPDLLGSRYLIDYSRLVGLAADDAAESVLQDLGKSEEAHWSKPYSAADIEEAKKELQQLGEFVKPERMASLGTLLDKLDD